MGLKLNSSAVDGQPVRIPPRTNVARSKPIFTLYGLKVFLIMLALLLVAHGVVEQGARLLPW